MDAGTAKTLRLFFHPYARHYTQGDKVRFLRFFIFIFFYPATLHAIEGISVYTKVHPQLSSAINLENELSIEFGVIPGAIFGQPLNSPLWLVKIDDSKSVAWPTKREKYDFFLS
jgi:hypothetical protein